MKDYELSKFNGLVSNKDREAWFKSHPNLIVDLPTTAKYIMMLMYHIREFSNLSDKTKFFNMVYPHINRYMHLLQLVGFITSKPNGRKKDYRITDRGNQYILDLFDYFRTGKIKEVFK